MSTKATNPEQATPELEQMSNLLETARVEAHAHALSRRRTPRIDEIEGMGAMVVSISPQQEIVAEQYDPNHDPASHERMARTEEAELVASIDEITQAHGGYRRAYLAPNFIDTADEQRPLYLERDAA